MALRGARLQLHPRDEYFGLAPFTVLPRIARQPNASPDNKIEYID